MALFSLKSKMDTCFLRIHEEWIAEIINHITLIAQGVGEHILAWKDSQEGKRLIINHGQKALLAEVSFDLGEGDESFVVLHVTSPILKEEKTFHLPKDDKGLRLFIKRAEDTYTDE